MRGVSLSFFKPSVFVKAFLVSCVVFSSAFFSSCKDLTSFDPNVDGGRAVTGSAFSAPVGLTATNGYKQKISLSWNPVSGAKNYEIWCAESPTAGDDGWKKVQVTDKIQHDDKVGAGRTLYYRVRAVKSTGATSPYSSIVKGTSLAVPVIGGGEVGNSSVTIQWFMENARGVDGKSNYEDELIFDISYQKKIGGDPITITKTATELGSEYKHTFENLAGTTSYQFWIEAHTIRDSAVEKSPVVDVNTLTSYTPLAPDFNATNGESAKGVRLYITLPEMVMVNTETHDSLGEKVDEPYPLYFEIWRKAADGANTSYEKVCPALYYNGSTTPPETNYYTSSPYKAGEEIEWFDESEDLVGGQKYTYKVLARVDTGYSKVVCPEGKEYTGSAVTPDAQAKTDEGWKSATPNFNVKEIADSKKYSEDKTQVNAVDFGFTVSWQDLGKAGDYKFAIKQHREPWNSSSGSDEDPDKWLENGTGKYFFDTLDEVKARIVKFGSVESGLKPEEEGIYTYTLYIVREGAEISDVVQDGEKVLDSVDAIDKALVTHEVNIPEAELTVKDGYTGKVLLTIHKLDENAKNGETVTYSLTRTKIEDGRPVETSEPIIVEIPENAIASGSYEYPDDTVEPNTKYSYVLKAAAESGAYSQSAAQEAETLGTPDVRFEMGSLAYDSVTISFNGVLAADHYVVKLGVERGFGNGEEFTITKDTSASDDSEGAESQDEKWSGSSAASGATANVTFVANRFTIKIEKPYGYDDARFAGLPANLTVTAHSENDRDSAESAEVSVNVLGPAALTASVNTSVTDDSISVSWNAVDGAKGYLIKRVMYSDTDMEDVAEGSDVVYYYNVSNANGTLSVKDEDGTLGDRATVAREENGFKLIDKDTPKENLGEYQEAQSKISWGLPFRYVVLPVLNENDFDFKEGALTEGTLTLASGGKVEYKNFEEKQTEPTATCGYGLNLVAEKAMSGNKQGLKWEKPYNADLADLTPVVYRRVAVAESKGSFDKFYENKTLKGEDAADVEITSDLYGAFEYIVKYYSTDITNIPLSLNVPKSLLATYELPEDEKTEKTEQNNKGYLLTLENFDAKVHPSKDYYEQISWKDWDYTTRAVGPDYMIIKVQNNNIDATYHEIVKITNANANMGTEVYETSNGGFANDVMAEAEAQATIAVAPKSIVESDAGTTNGMLKVLRDYKHKYTVELHRARKEFDRQDLGDEDDEISVRIEDYIKDYAVTAYRQITDEELIKTTMLVLADIVKDSKMESATTGTGTLGVGKWERAVDGATGYVDWWQNSTSRFRWRMSNYKHKWLTIPSNDLQNAFITLNDDYNDNNKGKKESGSLKYLFNSSNGATTDIGGSNSFDSNKLIPIYITGDAGLPDCYSGTLEFAAKKQYIKVKLSRNNAETFATKEFSGNDANYWCPINLDGNGYLGQNSDYGWW